MTLKGRVSSLERRDARHRVDLMAWREIQLILGKRLP